jgi:hypothetical protein
LMKILNFRKSERYEGIWNFCLQLEGFIVNSWTYSSKKKGVVLPPTNIGGRRLAVAYGIHFKRLKEMCEKEVKDYEQEVNQQRAAECDER